MSNTHQQQPSWDEHAAMVRQLVREHFPTPDHRAWADRQGEADARRLLDAAPADLCPESLATWMDEQCLPADKLYRRRVRHCLILLRMGRDFQQSRGRGTTPPVGHPHRRTPQAWSASC